MHFENVSPFLKDFDFPSLIQGECTSAALLTIKDEASLLEWSTIPSTTALKYILIKTTLIKQRNRIFIVLELLLKGRSGSSNDQVCFSRNMIDLFLLYTLFMVHWIY